MSLAFSSSAGPSRDWRGLARAGGSLGRQPTPKQHTAPREHPAVCAIGVGCLVVGAAPRRRPGRRRGYHSGAAVRLAAAWTRAPQPDFEDFAERLVGRWQGWRSPWISTGDSASDAPTDFTEVATEVSEIYRRCGSVTGIEDTGRRDMANPGFVYFDCGSWMEGPPSGVMSSSGSVTAAITVGACRHVMVVDWQQGKIGRATASIEYRQRTGVLPDLSEVASMPSGSLHELEAWPGEAVRATCASTTWSSLRLSWSKGPVGSAEDATSSDDKLKEAAKPRWC